MRLRNETSEAHRALEQAFDLPRALADEGHLERLLLALYAAVVPLERELARHLDPHLLVGRAKAAILQADLRARGLAPGACAGAPEAAALCSDGPEAMGVFYVLEGATLGGHTFSRALRRALPGRQVPRYFDPYGQRTGEMWRGVCDALARFSAPARDDRVIAAANDTFAFIGAALTPRRAVA